MPSVCTFVCCMNAGDALLLKPARGCRNDVPVENKKWCDESLAAIAFAVIPPSISLIYTFDMPLTPAQLHVVFELLPPYLPDLHALLALLGTSHSIRCTTLAALTPHTLLGLLSRTRTPVDLSDPLHLISYLAPGLQTWLAETHNRRRFIRAVRHGVPGMSRMARRYPAIMNANAPTDIARPLSMTLTLEALARNTARRQEIVTSLTDLVDKCVGVQWYSTPNFWDGGAEDAMTLWAEPDELLWRWVGYGELFGAGAETWYDWLLKRQAEADVDTEAIHGGGGDGEWRLPEGLRAYEVTLRCEYVKYILPDWHTPLEKYMGHRENGVSSLYPYPESLAGGSDDGSSMGDEGDDLEVGRIEDGDNASNSNASVGNTGSFTPELWLEAQLVRVSHVPDGSVSEWGGEDGSAAVAHDIVDHVHVHGFEAETVARADLTVPPTVHPLRATLPTGPYTLTLPPKGRMRAQWKSEEDEHISALIHLFERSPLFRRLAHRIRQRAIRLAHAQDRSLPHSPAQDRSRRLPPFVQAIVHAKYGLAEFGDLRDWKQVFWEDALWTGGWEGLELLFDEWERDEKNDPARMRRERRAEEVSPAVTGKPNREGAASDSSGTHPITVTSTPATDEAAEPVHLADALRDLVVEPSRALTSLPDDHPGLQRLVRIYAQLIRLRDEPKRVDFESIDRPRCKKMCTWLGPVFLGDLRAMQWSSDMGWGSKMR